ncbi:MAG: anaerobic carbon-monoxide dehydrogenase catalytic subunit [Nitrospirae bacterium]|nr:MAG: anaerobic carbon-monoxide dehydrogenase catalytic subunit [Nitrospirota bacterium]
MYESKSADNAASQILEQKPADIDTCFERALKMKPCPIGAMGACCRICHMGPCRLVGKDNGREVKGICGADVDTVVARNVVRMIAGGSSCHGDHGRDMALTLLAVANGKARDYRIKDIRKLNKIASILDIETGGRAADDIARDVATALLNDFGRQIGEVNFVRRAPAKTRKRWEKWGIVPRGIDREIVEAMDRTTMGMDADPDSLLLHGLRVAVANGWGGSMMSTEITDILFGTPTPVKAAASLGIFKEDEVNLVIHGHEPTLAEMIVEVVADPAIVIYANSKGAKGINLCGMCCTANEVMMRHGIASAGGLTNQEISLMTGLVEAMVVDVQCIMPALSELSKNFHTKFITTSRKARILGAVHIEFEEDRAREIATEIIKLAIDNFTRRTRGGSHITESRPVIAGFSHEYIEFMQGGRYNGSFRPLNDAIISGRIRGVVGLVGCDNPRVLATGIHKFLALELIRNDILVLTTGCGAAACGNAGYLIPEAALEHAGPGLREVCEAIGNPPILHLGSCVDNTRILTIAAAMAAEGGLSEEIGGMPAVGIAPEWMSEKAMAIGSYFAASGVPVIFGGESPVAASKEVTRIMTEVWYQRFRGALRFESDPESILSLAIDYIDRAREALKLRKYEPGTFSGERVLMDMAARRASK